MSTTVRKGKSRFLVRNGQERLGSVHRAAAGALAAACGEVRASKDATEASRVAQQNIVDTCQKRVRLTLPCARVIQSFYENEPCFVCNMMQYVFPDRSCTRHVAASCWRPFQSTAQVEAMELMIAEFQEKLDVTIAKLVLGLAFWAELAWLTSLMSLGTSTLDRGLCRPSNIDKFLSI